MRFPFLLMVIPLVLAVLATAEPSPLSFRRTASAAGAPSPLRMELAPAAGTDGLPEAEVYLSTSPGAPWHHGETLEGSFSLSPGLPPARLVAFLKDRDGHWFQALLPGRFGPGTNNWSVPFSSRAKDVWRPVGHHLAWNHRARLDPQFVGLRLFLERETAPAKGSCTFLEASLAPSHEGTDPPAPAAIRLSTTAPGCFSLLETSFSLPDRYDNPFDPGEIDASAEIVRPDGQKVEIPAFYTVDFFAEENATGVTLVPDGAPGWRVRYAPVLPGPHTLRIRATDRRGSVTSPPAAFVARPADGPAYIVVSAKDRRRFQAGTNDFHPIGHNIRSPFDARYDNQYPWRSRLPESYLVYGRYFEEMARAGENTAEIWMCQWSLGLEWSPVSPGYHGLGDYHLGNAWELDRVLEFAYKNGIRLNLVLNNHGRAGLGYDAEWGDSPYNERRGGFLPDNDPIRFFTDPRAIGLQKQICRYIVARWGWSPSILAFELWSELDLCGGGVTKGEPHDDPEVIRWHRTIGAYLKSIDPNKHLVTTHVSGNFHHVREALMKIPEIDHCCVDAYHGSADPLHIVSLVKESGRYFGRFGKPAMITEFGGSSMGAGVCHISIELHAALWASVCSDLAGTPLLWWWGLIDEQGLYHEFTAIKAFMEGFSFQDPALRPIDLDLVRRPLRQADGEVREDTGPLGQAAIASGERLCAWIYQPGRLSRRYYGTTPPGEPPVRDVEINWRPVSNGVYRVYQCDTRTGKPVRIRDYRSTDGSLVFPLMPFGSDIAVKAVPRETRP